MLAAELPFSRTHTDLRQSYGRSYHANKTLKILDLLHEVQRKTLGCSLGIRMEGKTKKHSNVLQMGSDCSLWKQTIQSYLLFVYYNLLILVV